MPVFILRSHQRRTSAQPAGRLGEALALREGRTQKVQECPAFPPAVVVSDFQSLQEHQNPENIRVPNRLDPDPFTVLLTILVDRLAKRLLDAATRLEGLVS
jgi:hypothetical protein